MGGEPGYEPFHHQMSTHSVVTWDYCVLPSVSHMEFIHWYTLESWVVASEVAGSRD